MTLAETLRQKRIDKKVTLKELSNKTEISPSFISDIEHGRRTPSVAALVKLAIELDFSIDEIFLSQKFRKEA